PVNNNSERGLLGIALHPAFATNRFVYLYWTCTAPAPADPFRASLQACVDPPTGSTDAGNVLEVPLLGNRVDRFVWNGTTLTYDRNLIKLRALQADSGQPARGNHDGGVLRFGGDGKLYIIFGDNGRRGFLQNITSGGPVPDDQFG